MSNPFKKQWQTLKRGRPGLRFRARYEAGQKTRKEAGFAFKFLRILRIAAALVSIAVGVVLMVIPGPAILFFFIAGGLLAAESITVARFLDWTEVKIREVAGWLKRHWVKLHVAGKITVTGLLAFGAGGCAYAAYRFVAG